jgi:uncharacterized membrane protein
LAQVVGTCRKIVGTLVGQIVGTVVGKVVGTLVGKVVGTLVGQIVGTLVRKTVRTLVGQIVGTLVGEAYVVVLRLTGSQRETRLPLLLMRVPPILLEESTQL